MKKQLICFDVDGTLDCKENDNQEYLKGVVPENLLVELWKKGYGIAIVSPSPYFPDKWKGKNHWFNKNGSNDYRWENILGAIKFYETSWENTIYVDDLESNRKQIEKFGAISYTPETFVEVFGE